MLFPERPDCVSAHHAEACERSIRKFAENRSGHWAVIDWVRKPDGYVLTGSINGAKFGIGVRNDDLVRA